MMETMKRFELCGKPCALMTSPNWPYDGSGTLILCCCGDDMPDMMPQIMTMLNKQEGMASFALLTVGGVQWDRDYAPWPSEQLPGRTFSGGSDTHYAFLTGALLAAVRPILKGWSRAAILGYSLGGLFALYAAMQEDSPFDCVASVSGALWYEGMLAYIHQAPAPSLRRAYLSLGKREAKGGRGVMGGVGEATQAILSLLSDRLGADNTTFELNNGNHFHEIPQRISRAIGWICKQKSALVDINEAACYDMGIN